MKCHYAKNSSSSDFLSKEYIKLNNSGWFENCFDGMRTFRESGRFDYQLLYVGSGNMNFNGKTLPAGNVYLYKPKEPQDYVTYGSNTSIYWIHFSGIAAEKLFADLSFKYMDVGVFDAFEEFCEFAVNFYNTQQQSNELIIEGKLLILLAELERKYKAASNEASYHKIEGIVEFINKNATLHLKNEEYAKMCDMSKYYFIKQFKTLTGKTPQKYRIDLLLNKSKMLLRDTNLRISEISNTLGFEDSLYFSRVFKKHFEISPMQYRNIRE